LSRDRSLGDLRLTQDSGGRMVLRRNRIEIGNSDSIRFCLQGKSGKTLSSQVGVFFRGERVLVARVLVARVLLEAVETGPEAKPVSFLLLHPSVYCSNHEGEE